MTCRRMCVPLLLLLLLMVPVGASAERTGTVVHDIRPGSGVSEVAYLSAYHPELSDTPGDTAVYILKGEKPGGVAVVLGGTHGNEIAGIMAAVLLVENAVVEQGTLVVIPHANNSAMSWSDPVRPGPREIVLAGNHGERRFLYGSRYTNPAHQPAGTGPYVHPSGVTMANAEGRNLNRVHPGKVDGSLTEQVSYAIGQILEREAANVLIDLHEAAPGSPLAHVVVSHPKGVDIAAMALLDLAIEGIPMNLERSTPANRGMSHLEWGDWGKVYSFLTETPNPGQRSGGALEVVHDPENPLWHRVGVQLAAVAALLRNYSELAPDAQPIVVRNIPTLDELRVDGFGPFLN